MRKGVQSQARRNTGDEVRRRLREAVKGEKLIVPHIEYKDRMTINLGERTFELIFLKNVHSEADTAVWMPKERVLFASSAANVRRLYQSSADGGYPGRARKLSI